MVCARKGAAFNEDICMVRLMAALLCATVMLHSGTASAADGDRNGPATQPEVIKRLFDCRKIEGAAARLDCFDRETAAVETAANASDLVIADRGQVDDAERSLFGLRLPKLGLFGGGKSQEEERASLETTLQSASVASGGKWLLVLEDGARWLQTDSTPVLGSPGAGDPVIIETAALGSYTAKIGSKRAFRVKRIN